MFPRFVSYEIGVMVGFNGGNDTYQFLIKHEGRKFRVYHTKYPMPPEPNIVVADAEDNTDELYLRTFLGKDSCDCNTSEEMARFNAEIYKAINQKFRVKGKVLASRLMRIVNQLNKGEFKLCED